MATDTGHELDTCVRGMEWWTDEDAYEHFVACVCVALVLLAQLFDYGHHRIKRLVYKHAHPEAVRNSSGKTRVQHEMEWDEKDDPSLWVLLFNQATGEITVLGFLAFVIWICKEAAVVDLMYDAFKSDPLRIDSKPIALPGSVIEFIQVVEAVHMQLFVTMLLYFIVMGFSVLFARRRMHRWQNSSNTISQGLIHNEILPGQLDEWALTNDPETEEFLQLLRSLLHIIVKTTDCVRTVDQHIPNETKLSMEALDIRFPLQQYLCMNYRTILYDMIDIQQQTWMAIVCLFGFHALTKKARLGVNSIMVCMLFGLALFLLCLCWNLKRFRTRNSAELKSSCHIRCARYMSLLLICRLLQMFLFGICFVTALNICDSWKWHCRFETTLLHAIATVVFPAPIGTLLGWILAGLSSTTACGTHITAHNLLRIESLVEKRLPTSDQDDAVMATGL
eukprot:TRINITY_DN21507_c0_g1_i1.p1 TRINITY_DN21507_c0_g1~~TRINITY_DN21507_c0_g1_i1.p1  ORF type:complete len:461 (+),score=69.76 TRINITY_DN21507_c0_g1_i1:37-1383(+)